MVRLLLPHPTGSAHFPRTQGISLQPHEVHYATKSSTTGFLGSFLGQPLCRRPGGVFGLPRHGPQCRSGRRGRRPRRRRHRQGGDECRQAGGKGPDRIMKRYGHTRLAGLVSYEVSGRTTMKKKSLIPLLLLGTSGTFYALGKRKPQARARERTPAVRTDLSPESISQSDIVMQHYMRFFVL